jgi:metal-dependent hydrolase (beta-lactamase superfamily II)
VVSGRNRILPYGSDVMLLSEHGLAFHLQSFRGDEEKQFLLDFALTPRTLTNNYQGLRVDPAKADALIISHGHVDHYGGLLDVPGASKDTPNRGSPSMQEDSIRSATAGSCNRTGKSLTMVN